MFFIDKRINLSRRDRTFMHTLPALAVFFAFAGITIWNWADLKHNTKSKQADLSQQSVKDVKDALGKRVDSYIDVVNSGVGLFEASDYVSPAEWKKFTNIFNLPNRYPGMKTLGFAKVNAGNDTAKIIYAQPGNKENYSYRGYDLYSDPTLSKDMKQARDVGQAIITQELPQDKGLFGSRPQFMIFGPVYAGNSDTLNQRRNNIAGYIYADIASYKLINEVADGTDNSFAFKVYDDNDGVASLIYKGPGFDRLNAHTDKVEVNQALAVNNRAWNVTGVTSPDIIPGQDRRRPAVALWTGLLFSAFLAIFIYMILLNRTRALADKESKEIQSAKDELLALASHQLRTPATGVKQYIGMLKEGYGGKMTREQKKYLNKAYKSNERQLNTINDMLFVARADTGNIRFDMKKTDLLSLVKEVLDEQRETIRENQQKLLRKLDKKPVYVYADKDYLRMAIENILSNATKYTKPGGTITVKLKKTKNEAKLTIEDTGVGVKQKYQYLLFRKFSRVPNPLSDSVSGSGIGLYLARKVTDAHQGKIEFKSIENEGSSCIITLSLYKNDEG
ncbi:MAG TPA: ATP-binding protein [Candidatus Saccharimonadales bacterium]|nr:ATP-binding protein [Candidatus Saccharimonadales bacterium]